MRKCIGGKIIQPGACGAITTGQTHWLSAQFSETEIIGIPIPEPVDIVITDSHPADLNLWQAAKRIYSADLTLAAHIVHVGRVIRENAIGVLVSSGIEPQTATGLVFHWSASRWERRQ